MITENLSALKIHKLTQAQYNRERDANRLEENVFYLTPDEVLDTTFSVDGNAADTKVVGDLLGNFTELKTTNKNDIVSIVNELHDLIISSVNGN